MKKKNRLVLPKKSINQFIEGVDNAPPEGWTEEAKAGAKQAAYNKIIGKTPDDERFGFDTDTEYTIEPKTILDIKTPTHKQG